MFGPWRAYITELAECRNLHIKLGGLAMNVNGFGFDRATAAALLRRDGRRPGAHLEHAIETFGARQVHVREQLPVDKGMCA